MAFVRYGPDSDVYVYSDGDELHCHDHIATADAEEMATHLEADAAKGLRVPPGLPDTVRLIGV